MASSLKATHAKATHAKANTGSLGMVNSGTLTATEELTITDHLDALLGQLSTTESCVSQLLDKFFSEGVKKDEAQDKDPYSLIQKVTLATHRTQGINEWLRDILNRV